MQRADEKRTKLALGRGRRLRELCREVLLPDIHGKGMEEVENALVRLTDTMHDMALQGDNQRGEEHRWDWEQDHWQRLLEGGDEIKIWQAIGINGWHGKLQDPEDPDRPSDEEFKKCFENLLNPENQTAPEINNRDVPAIPLLDNPFSPAEVDRAIDTMKNKAFLVVATGLFRLITVPILLCIMQLSLILAKTMYLQARAPFH